MEAVWLGVGSSFLAIAIVFFLVLSNRKKGEDK